MSFGGQSNAPWQRNVMQGHPQSNTFHQGTQQMYMQNAQQNNMAAFGHGGMQGGGGNMFPSGGGGPSVAYPQPRTGLNPVAFQQGSGQSQSHYNSIGTVTKINNDCGLVNDEVFFYRNVCKGPEPKLGDRVIFEATYANNGQFKWNATRIQLMQQQPQPLMGSSKGSYSSVAPPNEYQRSQMRHKSPKRSPIRGVGGGRHERDRRERERPHRSRDRDDEHERKRRREDRSHDKGSSVISRGAVIEGRGHASGSAARSEREKDKGDSRKGERETTDREREEREREREKDRARDKEMHRGTPKGRRPRTIKRYMVQIPKALLLHKTTNVHDLRHRYTTLYIPSDFFHANIKWSETFTPDNPFSLRRACKFHIMHKNVEPPIEQKSEHLEPADANYLYSAKVMLMALPPIADIYKKCFETDDDDIDHHAVHPSRLINFLVGVRGRNEPMAIGGPWSPSLDGENPDKDPSVLIRTAIRTCKALTGIDLSNCTQWYRFTELYYHRTEYKNMEKDGPPRVETVVIYLPDVHSCVPSTEEWQTLSQVYTTAADDVIARRKALVDAATAAAAAAANSNDDNDKTDETNITDNNATLAEAEPEEDSAAAENDESAMETTENIDDEDEKMDDSHASDTAAAADGGDDDEETAEAAEEDEQTEYNAAEAAEQNVTAHDGDDNENEKDEPAPEPTHYSLLDLKTMKIQEIRDELLARNLNDKGVRNVVMARLAKALNTEKSDEIKNKRKPKLQQSPQKTTAAKTANVASVGNKTTKVDEKMEVDQSASKPEDKKTPDNKKAEKKDDVKSKKIVAAKSKPKVNADKKVANKAKSDTEEQEDWADGIDFELSDIVILDEYDSSKNPEETLPKEMDEREKSQLIRRYTLPSSPQIVVHPNKNAKGGKFDCAVMSLSVLLDYHPDDTKERFFEVSLFAELFNEMLMRDFAFNIYKEVYLYEDPTTTSTSETADVKAEDVKKEKTESAEEVKKEVKEKDAKKDVKEKDVKKEIKEKDVKKEVKEKSSKEDTKSTNASENNSTSEKSSKDQQIEDTQSIKSESRKRKLSTSTSTANGKDTVVDKKMVVVKPQLLLSFVYFDTTHCGYIFEKDLEELFSLLGLNLSRSQIKKVLGKLATRQAIYYRKLTDKEESLEAIPCIEDVDDLPTEELQEIANGNNKYEAVFGRKDETNQVCALESEDNEDGLVNFNGAVIHVGKLINQIKRTEKNYSDLEKLHNDLLKQHSDLQKEQHKSTNKIKDIQAELKSVSRKLTDATQDLYSLNRKYRDQNSTLSYIYTRVAPYFVREKEKEKDAKTESSRDKDDKEKEKEKDKSKDTEKDKEKDIVKDDKEKIKDDKEKEKLKDDKEKVNDVKEKINETHTHKDDKEEEMEIDDKEKAEDDKEKEKVKDNKEKEKPKDDKEKEKPQVDKEKVNTKVEKEMANTKAADKEKEKVKDDKTKEKPKDDKEIVKVNKEKEKVKVTKPKESATPAKVVNKSLSTPARVVNKSLSTPSKMDGKSKKPADKVVPVSAKK